jgi:hypothetical protein
MHRHRSASARPGGCHRDDANQRDADENDCPFPAGVCALPSLFAQRMIASCAHRAPFRVDVTSVVNRAEGALSVR